VWGLQVVQAIARRNFPPVVAMHGSTILSIVEERHTEIVQQQTALAALPGVILWRIVRPERGNRSNAAEAICRAVAAPEAQAWAIDLHPAWEGLGEV